MRTPPRPTADVVIVEFVDTAYIDPAILFEDMAAYVHQMKKNGEPLWWIQDIAIHTESTLLPDGTIEMRWLGRLFIQLDT